MKKLIAALLLSLFLIAACQESSSIVAPTNDNSTGSDLQYAPAMEDTGNTVNDHGRPGLPRV